MHILTLETTCDETAAAIVTDRLEVLASVVASQDDLHRRFGGVVPEIASRAHVERILPVIDEALRKANLSLAEIDAVAVANTPGPGRIAAGRAGRPPRRSASPEASPWSPSTTSRRTSTPAGWPPAATCFPAWA